MKSRPEQFFDHIKTLPNFTEVDLLDVTEVPANFRYIVAGCTDPPPTFAELYEMLAIREFMNHVGDIGTKCLLDKNYDLFLEKVQAFKSANFQMLEDKYVKEFGDYNRHRLIKFYRAFHSKEEAEKYIGELRKENPNDNIYIYLGGWHSLYNQPPELCTEVKHANEIMNKVMGANLMHKKRMKMRIKERSRVLMEKTMKDREESGAGSMKFHKTAYGGEAPVEVTDKERILSDAYVEKRYAELDPTDILRMPIKSADDEKLLRDWLKTEVAIDGGIGVNIEVAKKFLSSKEVDMILAAKAAFKKRNEEEALKNEAMNKRAEVETKIRNNKK